MSDAGRDRPVPSPRAAADMGSSSPAEMSMTQRINIGGLLT
ncbi:hypothetical protein ABZV91_25440 [Nocardia sp. NPDC004568]